jgi:23S rRNA G2445 N2-methylase RlmL
MHFISTMRGGSPALAAELKDLGIKIQESGIDWCTAKMTDPQLKLLHLRSQAATRVLELYGKAADKEALEALAKKLQLEGSFCVRSNSPDKQEIEYDIGGLIHDVTGAAVKLERPDTLIYVYESDGEFFMGKDLFGDLSKRHYKIITGSQSLSGPFAYCALRLSGWSPKHDLVIWPCATGELAIEAALWAAEKSPRAYELKTLTEVEPKCTIIAADPKLSFVRSFKQS